MSTPKDKNLQDFYTNAGLYSCLASCYVYTALDIANAVLAEKELNEMQISTFLYTAWKEGTVDEDFYVKNPVELMNKVLEALGSDKKVKNVTKKDITSIKDLSTLGYAAVRFDFGGHSHFVLYKHQQLVWNSLSQSNCFRYGKPTTARVIEV